ncbi:5'-methylthioadenosine/S-adenosylhomocysteine nucleosidase [Nibricoccus sp. IMCC34717]|uniref:5'-methylthioadenosine/S-adenosylhomocysteine nucleosidase n=1 Tax=Nibricoccus sp. IMCC34717 TaxID=3034021 RepID=UPI00384AD0D6
MSRLLIVGALDAEVSPLRALLAPHLPAGLELHVALIGVGKTHAAAATQRFLMTVQPNAVVFAGVAGALSPELRIGDVGVVSRAIDADLDARNWRGHLLRGEHPMTGVRVHRSDAQLVSQALAAPSGNGSGPRLFEAYAASGSLFFDTPAKTRFREHDLPELADTSGSATVVPNVIDMETSAFLQVAADNGVRALALRAISDTTEGDAVADFEAFLNRASHAYAAVITHLLTAV